MMIEGSAGKSPYSRWWRWALAVAAFLLLSFAYLVFIESNTSSLASQRTVTIPRGASFKTIVDSLETSEVVRMRWSLDLAGRVLGLTKNMKVGKYVFPRGLSNIGILNDLEEGRSRILITLTIPEGWRMERIAIQSGKMLGADPQRFIQLCDSKSFRQQLGLDAPSLEGYLLPDTYKFLWQASEEEIIERMVGEFRKFYVDSLTKRREDLHLSLSQVLTLASIVEGEAVLDSERPIIAGVYLNRLRVGMHLEADPTIQYVIPDGPRRLTYSDLRFDSPYNTYRNYGLPPGPINNPGKKSILSVLYADKNPYFYFVADGSGGHVFSRTLSEHQKAVQSYRKARREAQKNSGVPG